MIDKSEDRSPNPVDLHVGARVRMRRKLLGVSQEKLADALGLTFQQVQKYERGTNRISASKLFEIGRFLQAPVSYFFEDMTGTPPAPNRRAQPVGLVERPPVVGLAHHRAHHGGHELDRLRHLVVGHQRAGVRHEFVGYNLGEFDRGAFMNDLKAVVEAGVDIITIDTVFTTRCTMRGNSLQW